MSDEERKTTICGTPNYIAPEILDGKYNGGHSFEVDIWSIGVIMYTMLFGKPPFETKNIKLTYNKIRTINYSFNNKIPVSNYAKELIKSILQKDAKKRPNIKTILNNIFFKGYKIPKTLPKYIINKRISKSDMITKDTKNKGEHTHERTIKVITYVDYSKKYGIGYILSNKQTGVYYNDNTKILLYRGHKKFVYIDDNTCKEYDINKYDSSLNKKVTLLKHFHKYLMNKYDINMNTYNNSNDFDKIYVREWVKTKYAILFKFNNKNYQINFTDNTQLIFISNVKKVIFINKNNNKIIYDLNDALNSNDKGLSKRIKYTKELLKHHNK